YHHHHHHAGAAIVAGAVAGAAIASHHHHHHGYHHYPTFACFLYPKLFKIAFSSHHVPPPSSSPRWSSHRCGSSCWSCDRLSPSPSSRLSPLPGRWRRRRRSCCRPSSRRSRNSSLGS
ncbi:hypothetical protein PENTCL1PPCAC_14018, partial [Pristionchus entomophagus]